MTHAVNADWLDGSRQVGDPLVDELLVDYLDGGDRHEAGRMLASLFGGPEMPSDHPVVARYLAALRGEPVIDDAEQLAAGQRLFQVFGPEVLITLGSYALPLAYAAGNGVQVIYRARRFKDDPIRRLCDTAQMVVNVMQPGALAVGAPGWCATRKVRLIHAIIRHQVQQRTAEAHAAWRSDWGVAINQEDLAGTLLTFSIAVLHGLRRMGARITSQEADSYIRVWAKVGGQLGLVEELRPRTEAEAIDLALLIGGRQFRSTAEGRELMGQLLPAIDSLFPFPGYSLSLTHFFLHDTVFGADVARLLDLPSPNWTRHVVRARAAQKRLVLRLLDEVPGGRRRRRFLARRFVQAMIALKRPDARVPFEVPTPLTVEWGLTRPGTSAPLDR